MDLFFEASFLRDLLKQRVESGKIKNAVEAFGYYISTKTGKKPYEAQEIIWKVLNQGEDPSLEFLYYAANFCRVPMEVLMCSSDELKAECLKNKDAVIVYSRENTHFFTEKEYAEKCYREISYDENCEKWPYNLVRKVSREYIPMLSVDKQEAGVMFALTSLDHRTREMILEHFCDGKSSEAVGKKYGVSRQRANQIINDGIIALRHPSRKCYVLYGTNTMKKRDDEIFADLKRYVGNVTVMVMIGKKKRKLSLNGGIIPLEMLDLSPRARKALYGMNCETLNDALSVDFETMLSLENVGAKSLREIAAKVSDITGEAWPFVDKNGQESNPKLKFDLKGETIRRFNNNKAAAAATATVGP